VLLGRLWRAIRVSARIGAPDLISPSAFIAIFRTLIAVLLSLSGFGQPNSSHVRNLDFAARVAAAKPFTLGERAIAPREEADCSNPHHGGGDALPPAELARAAVPAPSGLSPVPLAELRLAKRSIRAHPATGPPGV